MSPIIGSEGGFCKDDEKSTLVYRLLPCKFPVSCHNQEHNCSLLYFIILNLMIAPVVLILLGVIFLLQKLNIIPDASWDMIWPILLIVVGLSMMYKRMKRQDRKSRDWNEPR